MIRRAFLQMVVLSAGVLPGWLKGRQDALIQEKVTNFDIARASGWTVTHRIDKYGLHVIRSTRTLARGESCHVCPPEVPGFERTCDVMSAVNSGGHWDLGITDREIPRGP